MHVIWVAGVLPDPPPLTPLYHPWYQDMAKDPWQVTAKKNSLVQELQMGRCAFGSIDLAFLNVLTTLHQNTVEPFSNGLAVFAGGLAATGATRSLSTYSPSGVS
uniref:Uncharacterized protein n=1 Tax=Eutreptiella gymnastica TaxID=73025 RepID=A0A7S4LD23_9EUGL